MNSSINSSSLNSGSASASAELQQPYGRTPRHSDVACSASPIAPNMTSRWFCFSNVHTPRGDSQQQFKHQFTNSGPSRRNVVFLSKNGSERAGRVCLAFLAIFAAAAASCEALFAASGAARLAREFLENDGRLSVADNIGCFQTRHTRTVLRLVGHRALVFLSVSPLVLVVASHCALFRQTPGFLISKRTRLQLEQAHTWRPLCDLQFLERAIPFVVFVVVEIPVFFDFLNAQLVAQLFALKSGEAAR